MRCLVWLLPKQSSWRCMCAGGCLRELDPDAQHGGAREAEQVSEGGSASVSLLFSACAVQADSLHLSLLRVLRVQESEQLTYRLLLLPLLSQDPPPRHWAGQPHRRRQPSRHLKFAHLPGNSAAGRRCRRRFRAPAAAAAADAQGAAQGHGRGGRGGDAGQRWRGRQRLRGRQQL